LKGKLTPEEKIIGPIYEVFLSKKGRNFIKVRGNNTNGKKHL
jgi:hypothetical protein